MVESGVGAAITALFHSTGISPLIFAWLVAAIFKTSQGSSATAMITVSAMFAPLLPTLGLTCNPVYLVTAIASGSMVFSWMNDSGFWVIAKLCQYDGKGVPQNHFLLKRCDERCWPYCNACTFYNYATCLTK